MFVVPNVVDGGGFFDLRLLGSKMEGSSKMLRFCEEVGFFEQPPFSFFDP